MSVSFHNCIFCNKIVDDTYVPETGGYDISFWISLCKIFRVTPNESHLNTFPSCRLCRPCHDLAIKTSETLTKLELIQTELEELSHKLKSVLRKTEILGRGIRGLEEPSPYEWLRTFLSTNLQCGEENQILIEVLPIWEEDFRPEDNDSQLNAVDQLDAETAYEIHPEISTNVAHTGGPDDTAIAAGAQSSENEQTLNNFRTFTVQGYVLKDLEIRLERLSREYISNAAHNCSRISTNLDHHEAGEHATDNEGEGIHDDASWVDESSTDSSEISSEDDYQPRRNQKKKKEPGTVPSGVGDGTEIATNRDDEIGSQSKQLSCKVCGKDFPNERLQKQHRQKEHPLSCTVCGKLFKNARLLRGHVKRHTKDKICTQCGKNFAFNCDLRNHEQTHRTDEQQSLSCPVCGKLYTNFRAWRSHKLRHIKDKKCTICGRAFSFNCDLKDHERSHRTEDQIKNLACEPCNLVFDSRDAFLEHRTHEHSADGNVDEDKVQCLICVKVFNSVRYLRAHMKLHQDKKHSCEICGSSFNNRPKLRVHMKRSHNRDKICAQCGKAFAFSCELRKHERTHKEDRRRINTLTCKSCKLSFNSWAAVVEHRKKEHPEEVNADDEKHKCHICEKILSSSPGLRRHMESHEGGNHPCEICGVSFTDILRLKRHMKRHEKNKTCEDCGKNFTSDSALRNHRERIHIRENERGEPYCKPCNQTFDSWPILRRHWTQEHPEDMSEQDAEEYQCQICGRITDSNSSLQKHMRVHRNAGHVCETCGKSFSHLSILKKHIIVNHASNSDKVSHTCDVCGIVLFSRLKLLQHVRQYHKEKKYVCETCGKRFVETRNLKQHLSTHTKEKPFTCELCGKGAINLQIHQVGCLEKLSTEEKSFKCSQCDKAFHLEASLKRHERMHSNSDRFECEVCHKKFRLNCLLVQHRRSHFPEESIPCSMCSATFKLQCELKWHMEYDHLGNREKCSICGYEAKSRVLFKRHELEHKVGKRFGCDVCGKKFFKRDHLKRHQPTHEKKSKKSVQANEDEESS